MALRRVEARCAERRPAVHGAERMIITDHARLADGRELPQDDLPGAGRAERLVDELVPMGQLAAALGVVPGTATTMVKTLAESGLVHYEPYMGVRLTPAGEKLAGLVLRRHRLIELFLVQGARHELGRGARRSRAAGARRLRAADRSHRRDARPAGGRSARRSDSHGRRAKLARHDLPGPAERADWTRRSSSPASSTRTPSFLRFVEQRDLDARASASRSRPATPASDSVHLVRSDGRHATIGTRAAVKDSSSASELTQTVDARSEI